MSFREVTMFEIKEVLRRWLAGADKSEIARQCGIARGTVRRYIATAMAAGLSQGQDESSLTDEWLAEFLSKLQPDRGRPHGPNWERCSEHREFIKKHLKGGVRLSKIRKLLRRQKVQVSYSTLWRFATAELGMSVGETTMPVADGEAGKELQVDTGWVGQLTADLCGRRRRFRAWIFTPVVSRLRFVYPVSKETTETAIEACEAAWEFYGGVFGVLIPDNTKAIVQKADPLEPLLNRGFLEYSQARGFFIDPTRVRSPKDKARVERAVRTVRDDCYAGERLLDLEHARQCGRTWCLEEYGMQRHGTTGRLPREHFEAEERGCLKPAPSERYEVPSWCEPKVHRDQHAQVAKALYSLPRRFVGRTLHARADSSLVRFYDGMTLVKMHSRVAAGKRQTDPADFPPEKAVYAMRDVDFLKRKAAGHGDAVGRYATALLDSELPWTRMRQVYALLGLVKRYGADRVNDACTTALAVELVNIYRLRRLIEIAPASTPFQPSVAKVLPGRFLRPLKQTVLPFTSPASDDDNPTKGEAAQ